MVETAVSPLCSEFPKGGSGRLDGGSIGCDAPEGLRALQWPLSGPAVRACHLEQRASSSLSDDSDGLDDYDGSRDGLADGRDGRDEWNASMTRRSLGGQASRDAPGGLAAVMIAFMHWGCWPRRRP